MSNLNKEYWKKRAELAEAYIATLEANDYMEQIGAVSAYNKFISSDTTLYEEKEYDYKYMFTDILSRYGMGYNQEIAGDFHKVSFGHIGTNYNLDGYIVTDRSENDMYKHAYDILIADRYE